MNKLELDLDRNQDNIDAQDLKDEVIEAKSNEFFDRLMKQHFVLVGGVQYHFDDFVGYLDIDPYLFWQMSIGDHEPLHTFIHNSLNDYCMDLAKEFVEINNL